jgi:hypothetical protein
MDTYLQRSSIDEKGTLYQLKSRFGHTAASGNVSQSFTHTEDLLRFTAEAHVSYLATDLLPSSTQVGRNVNNRKQVNNYKPVCIHQTTPSHDKMSELSNLAKIIRKTLWCLPSAADVQNVLDADIEGVSQSFCHCNGGNRIFLII